MNAAFESVCAFLLGQGSYALVLALPIILVFAHRGVAPILLVMAIAAASARGPWKSLAGLFAPPFSLRSAGKAGALSLAAFALWIAVSGFWSPQPGAWNLALIVASASLASFFAFAGVFTRENAALKALRNAFVLASLVGLALLSFEAASSGYLRLITPPADASPNRIQDMISLGRGVTALLPSLFAMIGLIALGAVGRNGNMRAIHFAAVAAIAIAALFAALRFPVASNTAGLLAGFAAAGLAFLAPGRAIAGLTFAYVGALILAPVLAFLPASELAHHFAGEAPNSWLQRLFIWRHAAHEALACLPAGCGADYARGMSVKEIALALSDPSLPLTLTPRHPHSLFLQIWLELGIPGVALATVFFFAAGRGLLEARLQRITRAAICGAGAATLVSFLIEASLWQAWRLAAVGIGACGLALLHRFESDDCCKAGALS